MQVTIAGVPFDSPVIAASGTFGFGFEYLPYVDMHRIGGVALKALTPLPREGNPVPRICETPAGVLNSIGLQNPGAESFCMERGPRLAELGCRVIANVAGSNQDDYLRVIELLEDIPIDMYELNVSCPNVRSGGMSFGRDPEAVRALTANAATITERPLMVKLTPNTDDITAQAQAAKEGGAKALSLINTLLGMAVDADTHRPMLANITGGLSGPAVKPVALRMVHEVYKAGIGLPIIGMGGILTGRDAAEFMICGADAVMAGTATLRDPSAVERIARELEEFANEQGLSSVSELTGSLKAEAQDAY
ncbi:MAG: dihydroorotate dehydrogenase [Clostridia bacterium]|nr:dihydroorotate dehydrogenase [Clostridia bacterium]